MTIERARTTWVATFVLVVLVAVKPTVAQTPREFYAAPNGLPSNSGSVTHPLDLHTALSAASPVRAGDTLWLRGGRYVGNFTSVLAGSVSAPIRVRQYPGERATIDAATSDRTSPALSVRGADTWFWGFEVTDTTTGRRTTNYGADPKRATSIDVTAPRTRFINMVVHDGQMGFGAWTGAVDTVIYGTIISNVGVEAPDRGHGHSIYVQNDTGIKRIVDNFLLYSFSFGVHAYTETARVDRIEMEGNTIVGAGLLSLTGAKANVLTGGRDGADFTRAVGNVLYYPALDGRGFDLGYITPCSNPVVRDNYVVAETPVSLGGCSNVTLSGNTFYGATGSLSTLYPANTYHAQRPTDLRTFVRPNTYEPGRANITVVNWSRAATVAVDVSSAGLPVGGLFEVRDAQNFFGPAVVTGTYTGAPIVLPMTGLIAARPVGDVPIVPPHTAPELGTFVLLPMAPPQVSPLRLDGAVPSSGPASGATRVTLSGAGFDQSVIVKFGGIVGTGLTVVDPSVLTVSAPAGSPGPANITVTRGAEAASGPAFSYLPVPPRLALPVVTGLQATLQWSADASTPVQEYTLLAGPTPGSAAYGGYPMGHASGVTAAVAPGRYYVRVVGNTVWGPQVSNEVVAIVNQPGPPPAPQLALASVAGRTVRLEWSSSPDATVYAVVARLSPGGVPVAVLPVGALSLVIDAPPGTYYVQVAAANAMGPGPLSNQIVVDVR